MHDQFKSLGHVKQLVASDWIFPSGGVSMVIAQSVQPDYHSSVVTVWYLELPHFTGHSCFITVVDGTEQCTLFKFQNHEDESHEGRVGHNSY